MDLLDKYKYLNMTLYYTDYKTEQFIYLYFCSQMYFPQMLNSYVPDFLGDLVYLCIEEALSIIKIAINIFYYIYK